MSHPRFTQTLLYLLSGYALAWGQPPIQTKVYLTLGSTSITTNNTEVLITDIGEDVGGLSRLTCHTDLAECCRISDTGGQGGRGEWYYPDGRAVQNNADSAAAGEDFYRVRNAPQVVRLAKRKWSFNFPTPGSYCCVIPTTEGVMTFCANLVICQSLSPLPNGTISYSDLPRVVGSVASHSYDTGYILNGETTRTCQRDGTWSGAAPTCQVCLSLPHLTNGMISYSNPVYAGSAAIHSCDSGYALIGRATRTCQSDGTWSGSAPMCEVDCGSPPPLLNGLVNLHTGTTTFNSLAFYSCNLCFVVEGISTCICDSSGNWIPGAPSCQIVDCGLPPDVTNGRVHTSPSTVCNSAANYSCNPGYLLMGNNTRTCQANEKWSDLTPVCKPVECGPLSDPPYGQVSTSAGTTFNKVAHYSCNNGYILVGSMTRTCAENGRWSPSSPRCDPVDCGSLSNPLSGQVDTSSGTTFMSVAIYGCDTGHILNGGKNRTCRADGAWSNRAPTCQIVDCGLLDHPRNGRVNTDSGTTYNSVATCSCNEGYYLVGYASRTCMANGEWSPPPSMCNPVNCGPLQAPANGHVDTSQGTLFTSIATYSCDPGYNLTGSTAIECLSSGSWSNDPPFCADNAMIQFKFGPTSHCVIWSDWKVNLLYMKMQSLVLKAIQSSGHVIPKENIQQGYFSCYRSTTETTYRTTITGTERVSAVDYADLIQEWVESGVTTRVQWYVIKIDKNCPVSVMSMDDEECQ